MRFFCRNIFQPWVWSLEGSVSSGEGNDVEESQVMEESSPTPKKIAKALMENGRPKNVIFDHMRCHDASGKKKL